MRRRRIMVVEDSLTGRAVLVDMLADLGYQGEAYCSAEEAQRVQGWDRYDAYLFDMRLPGASGLDLLKTLKQRNPEAIVVLVTQYEHSRVAGVLETYDNVWFLKKPAELYTLATVLKNAFEAEELRRDLDRFRSLSLGLKSVGRVRDLDQEFKVLLHLAVDSLEADAGVVLMLADEQGPATVRTGIGLDAESGVEVEVAGVLARCVHEVQPEIVNDARLGDHPELSALLGPLSRVHALSVPLVAGQRLVGALQLFRDRERREFHEKDAALAKLYAATAAVALENLTLLDDARRAYERQLDAQRELIQSRKLSSLGQVTAGIAHEIKNPLTVIVGNVGLIRKKAPNAGIDEYVDRIEGQVDRIHRLMLDLKTVYHPGEAGHSRFSLHDLVEEALCVAPAPHGRVEVRCSVAEGEAIHGDFGQLLQVLVNLISNAYQALERTQRDQPGGLWIEHQRDGEDHILVVRDDGPGIPAELRSRVFEPFYTTKGAHGTGLGLWISQTILRGHGGGMEIVEHPDGGACFHLRFPPPPQDGVARLPRVRAVTNPGAPREETPARILVLDDEEEIRAYLCELLRSEGYEVIAATSTRGAEVLLEGQTFDLALIDEHLAGMSGREFFARVLRPRYRLPTVLFTGSDEITDGEAQNSGFYGMIRKPARAERILDALTAALEAAARDEVRKQA